MSTADVATPSLRGVSHQYAFFVAVPAAVALVMLAPTGAPTTAAVIYAFCLCGLLGISALYHRVDWSLSASRRMRQLDHSMIFVFIAGSFTPFPMLVLDPEAGRTLLLSIWGAALFGLFFKQFWLTAPSWVSSALYVATGCIVIPYADELVTGVGSTGMVLLKAGGIAFVVGAGVYATRWPNPNPDHFGYHEVFHLLVLAGVTLHYIAIAFYAIGIA